MAQGEGTPEGAGQDPNRKPDGNDDGRDADGRAEGFRRGMEAERAKRQELERRLSELERKAPSHQQEEQPKEYSRAELQELVENGRLSQGEADRLHEEQTRRRLEEGVTKRVEETLAERQRSERIRSEIDRYKEIAPEIMEDGSDLRQRVEQEFRYLMETVGRPSSAETELEALRAALGPVERLGRKSERAPESYPETAADGGSRGAGSKQAGDGAPKGLTADEKSYYEDLIRKGAYGSWKDVEKELAYADANLRQRMGARGS